MEDGEDHHIDGEKIAKRIGAGLFLTLALLAGVGALVLLSLNTRTVPAPQWLSLRIEGRLSNALYPAQLDLANADLVFNTSGLPEVALHEVTVSDATGRPMARLPDVRVSFDPRALLRGEVRVLNVSLTDAEITVRRNEDGDFNLLLGDIAEAREAVDMAKLLDQIDASFAIPALASIETVAIEGLDLAYQDLRAGRSWRVEDGLMTMDQSPNSVGARLFFSLTSDLGVPSEVAIGFETVKGSPEARMSANFSDMPSSDIASQSPALAFLTLVDAPISGAMRTGVNADGSLAPLAGTLEVGAGALRPEPEAAPIRFDGAKGYFSFSPQEGKIVFDDVTIETAALSLGAEGHSYLRDEVDGWPTSLVSQMRLRHVRLSPEGIFEAPASFNGGAVDMKITLDPFTAEIGQAVLLDEGGDAIRAKGSVGVDASGWRVGLDMDIDEIDGARLLSLWPVTLAAKTRKWVTENVFDGKLFDVRAALRLVPNEQPKVYLTHEFRDATVRFMKTMPPVENGFGYLTIADGKFDLVVDMGTVTAPSGGKVDATGTTMHVDDIRRKPAYGEISLVTDGSIEAMLSLLDQPPLNLMSRAGQPVDLAVGRAQVQTKLGLELRKGVKPNEVSYAVTGTLTGVRSDKLVKGRVLSAERLNLSADNQELTIGGAGALDGIPVTGLWTQKIGPEHKGKSRVEGTVELSEAFVKTFQIGLPDGSVSGAGVGNVVLDLTKGEPTAFTLSSDLARVGLSLSSIGWSKPRNAKGALDVAGLLSSPPRIDTLSLSASGLVAEGGRVTLTEDSTLAEARFDRVRLNGWLDAPVILRGRGKGVPPAVRIDGGRLDVRKLPAGTGGNSSGSSGPVDIALSELRVSEGIALRSVRGSYESGRNGGSGALTGTIDGVPVKVNLSPHENGTQIRITSDDAGGVLRGAGIFEKSNGGTMDLLLRPLPAAKTYRGNLKIARTRVKGAPALAELLSAISVVGLIEMVDGEGLMFGEVDVALILTPEGVEVTRGSATGPSLGLSMAGIYRFSTGKLNMQGVISPIYLVNSIGSVLTRKGEGLFGFNYRLKGDAKDPKVQVNPLSILTPGMFREIFRSSPPELAQ